MPLSGRGEFPRLPDNALMHLSDPLPKITDIDAPPVLTVVASARILVHIRSRRGNGGFDLGGYPHDKRIGGWGG